MDRIRSRSRASSHAVLDISNPSISSDLRSLSLACGDVETTPRQNGMALHRFQSFTTNTDDEVSYDMSECPSEYPDDGPKLAIYDILNIQLNALWVNQINEAIADLTATFPNSTAFRTEIHIMGDSEITQLIPGPSLPRSGEEFKMLAWYNSVVQLLGLLESILTQLRKVTRYQIESNDQQSLIVAGTSLLFKEWLRDEINAAEESADSNPECSLCPEPFDSILSEYIKEFSVTTARLFDSHDNTQIRRNSRKGSKNRIQRVKEPYHLLNQTMLRRIIPILLKVRPLLDKSLVRNNDLYAALRERSNYDGPIVTVTLAEVFQNHLIDSDWLKDHLAEIEIRFAHNYIKLDDDDQPDPISLPDWLPDLGGLYSLMVVIMLRYPTSLAKHVLKKFKEFAKSPSDHSNFIAEMRPVLEECAISIFCAETLNLGSISSGQFSVLDSIETARKEFRLLLKTYINGVIIPRPEYLSSDHFDRSEFLQRINSLDILSEDARDFEAASIGSLLKHELNRLKALCKRMHISSTPFLCYNFSNVVKYLLDAISTWFDRRIIKDQHKLLDEFLNITTTDDLANPVSQVHLLRRQLSFKDQYDMENYRDERQKELLGKMMIGLRTNKSLFIDEEAQKVCYFEANLYYIFILAPKARIFQSTDLSAETVPYISLLGLCKLQNEILKKAKNAQKCNFSAFLASFKM